jgi:hypothetical protein
MPLNDYAIGDAARYAERQVRPVRRGGVAGSFILLRRHRSHHLSVRTDAMLPGPRQSDRPRVGVPATRELSTE